MITAKCACVEIGIYREDLIPDILGADNRTDAERDHWLRVFTTLFHRNAFERAAPTYDAAAVVQRRVCDLLAAGLPAMPPVEVDSWISTVFARGDDTPVIRSAVFDVIKK